METEFVKEEAEAKKEEPKKLKLFEGKGGVSMRRVSAFFMFLAAIALMCVSLFETHDWKIILVCGLVPALTGIVLLFFTTWQEVAEVVKAVRK